MTLKRHCIAGFLSLVMLGVLPSPASAQLWLEISKQDEYLTALMEVVDRWESGGLTLEKQWAQERFDSGLKRIQRAVDNGDKGLESQLSVEAITVWWDELPEKAEFRPTSRLSDGARVMIMAFFIDRLPPLANTIKPDPDAIIETLGDAPYILLAPSQREALLGERRMIGATAVQRGGFRLFSLGWPFCCAYERS